MTTILTPAMVGTALDVEKTMPIAFDQVKVREESLSTETHLSTEEYLRYDAQFSVKGMPSHPVVMARGQGSFLWDLSGKRYIDFNAGFSACNQGHCHPKIVEVMMKQCQLLTMPSRSVHVGQYALFCKKVCEITNFDRVAAMNGGAEAVDLAIKIARSWGYKRKRIEADKALVVTASHNYHGRTLSILSASTDDGYRKSE